MMMPPCPKCKKTVLLPLSDYGTDAAAIIWKAWCCANSKCGFSVRIDKGRITYEIIRS